MPPKRNSSLLPRPEKKKEEEGEHTCKGTSKREARESKEDEEKKES
jgi:hypothetical protein